MDVAYIDSTLLAVQKALYVSSPTVHAPLDTKTALQTGQSSPSVAAVLSSFGLPVSLSSINAKVSTTGASYVPVQPLTQYKGVNKYGSVDKTGAYISGFTSWQQGLISFFKLDANNVPIQIWDESSGTGVWRPYAELLGDPMPLIPLITGPVMDDQARSEIALNMAASGMFKPKTAYLDLGDDPPGDGTIDLKSMLTPDDYNSLLQYLTFMPRQFLHNFFMQKIYPGIPWSGALGQLGEGKLITDHTYGDTYAYKSFQDMVWAAFVDMFNVANLAYINKNQISDPWAWEQQKLTAYYQSQDQASIDTLRKQFDQFNEVTLALDPLAKKIMDDFATLPKLGDVGLEINRQNAIKELLKMQEYTTAQAIVDAYRYTKDTVLGDPLTKPIAKDVVLKDGTVVAQKSTPAI